MRKLLPGLLLGSLLLAACNSEEAAPAAPATAAVSPVEFTRSVRTITAVQGTLSTERRATVTVEAAQESMVASGANGRVQTIVAPEGSSVLAGDVVIQLDDEQLRFQVDNARVAVESARVSLQMAESAAGEGGDQARAARQTAQLNLDLQQRLYDEAGQLFAAGAIARAELDGLATQLSQARAALQQAEDAVAQASRAGGENLALLRLQLQAAETQLSQAESMLAEAAIRAPFDGTVVMLLANPGEFVGAGQPVFQLSSTGPQLARFSVPTEDVPVLMQDPDITISYAGLDYSARLRPSSGIPAQGRQVRLTAEVHGSQNPIPNGAVASFTYGVELATGALLPSAAIRAGNTVLVADQGRAEPVTVEVVAEAGGQAVVTGLPDDAAVVYPLPADLTPGTALEVID